MKMKSKPFSNFIEYPSAGGWTTHEIVKMTSLDNAMISRIKVASGMRPGQDYYYKPGDSGKVVIMYSDEAVKIFLAHRKRKRIRNAS